MFQFKNGKKNKWVKITIAIVAILLVLAMIIPMLLSSISSGTV